MAPASKGADIIASDWLANFDVAASSGDIKATTALFVAEGWLKDLLVLTWTHRSLHGHDSISNYLSESDNLKRANLQNFWLDCGSGIPPSFVENPGAPTLVEATFTFETPIAYGKGLVRLLQDQGQEWKALMTFLTIDDLKGHEEQGFESGIYEEHTKTWNEVNEERRARIETDPYVIIIGAGQTGLNVGARFRQMNIPTLLIERENAVGNVWRQRYPTLTLHTPNVHHSMLYQRYPKNWPKFTPRDKVASWLEQYAMNQDLVIWTNSTVGPNPSYNTLTKRWTIDIIRDGTTVTLHPHHVVSAMGTLGKPWVPSLPGLSKFKGEAYHATDFRGGQPYVGKKTIVIGAGNSGADICQDLAARGAASVTMVQRSTTIVVEKHLIAQEMENTWKWQQDTAIGDFWTASTPIGLLLTLLSKGKSGRVEAQKDMHDGLRKAGLKIDEGPSGAGFYHLLFKRFGGYWFDVGTADMIIKGKIKVKQGSEPTAFVPEGLVFKDGSTLDADLVVFATGYESILEQVREMFGEEVAQRTGPVWGLNEESELNKCFTPSGYPGFWYALGDFHISRFYSKALALQIKARELGLVQD